MTEREKRLIESYIPNPRDKSLGDDEYYILDDANRVQKVYITDIAMNSYGEDIYGVRYASSGRHFLKDGAYLTVHMYDLYDNKEDCKNGEHFIYENWEKLRKLQEEQENE